MSKKSKLIHLVLLLLLAALNSSAAMARELSAAQVAQVKTLGYPEFFMLVFSTREVDPKTRGWRILNPPAVMETWMYVTKAASKIVFSNGKQVSKAPLDKNNMSKLLPGTQLKPGEFDPSMGIQQIKTKFGKPDMTEQMSLGKHNFEVLRYLTPARGVKSFTFFDGKLQGVLAGYAIVPKKKP